MALFETVVENSLVADWNMDMGFFGLLVSNSNTSSDRVMSSDVDMPLNTTSNDGKWPVFWPTGFWCESLKIVLPLVRSELSELFLILNQESLSDLSFSPVGFLWWNTRKITDKDVIIIIDSPESLSGRYPYDFLKFSFEKWKLRLSKKLVITGFSLIVKTAFLTTIKLVLC